MSMNAVNAHENVMRAALRVLSAERGREDDPHFAAELDYAEELLALAARELTRATDALPEDEQPVGWREEEGGVT